MRFKKKNRIEEPDLASEKAMRITMKSLEWIFNERKYKEIMNKEL